MSNMCRPKQRTGLSGNYDKKHGVLGISNWSQ
jgi:hypothetical protein